MKGLMSDIDGRDRQFYGPIPTVIVRSPNIPWYFSRRDGVATSLYYGRSTGDEVCPWRPDSKVSLP